MGHRKEAAFLPVSFLRAGGGRKERDMDIICPHCKTTLEGSESLVGEIVDCPYCEKSFEVKKDLFDVVEPSPSTDNANTIGSNAPFANTSSKSPQKFQSQSNRKNRVIGLFSVVLVLAIVSAAGVSSALRKAKQREEEKIRKEQLQYEEKENARKRKESEQAAELYQTGMKYLRGDGVLQNGGKAVRLLKEAGDKGNEEAWAALAIIYWAGEAGEREDIERAVSYAEKFENSSLGHNSLNFYYPLVKNLLGEVHLYGYKTSDGAFVQDFEKAYKYLSYRFPLRSSARGMTGLMTYYGIGTAGDKEKAAEIFYEACSEMNEEKWSGLAAICLGWMYLHGDGITRNESEAWKWLQYGVRTAFPEFVEIAKRPLTESDRRRFNSDCFGELSSFTPYSYKMFRTVGDEGIIHAGDTTMDLINKGILCFFNPDYWQKPYRIDEV